MDNPVAEVNHESEMLVNAYHVLSCPIYPDIHDHVSIAGFQKALTVLVFSMAQLIGEISVGIDGGIVSIGQLGFSELCHPVLPTLRSTKSISSELINHR